MEMKDQQIHTELIETQHQHVPAGRTPEQQGRTHAYNNNILKQAKKMLYNSVKILILKLV